MGSNHNRQDEPVEARRPEWLPIVTQAAQRRSTRGLPTPPPGLPHGASTVRNGYYNATRYKRADGSVRVWLKWCVPGWRTTVLGAYNVPAAGRVPVGLVMTRSDGLQVQIVEHPAGLPWPVLVLP